MLSCLAGNSSMYCSSNKQSQLSTVKIKLGKSRLDITYSKPKNLNITVKKIPLSSATSRVFFINCVNSAFEIFFLVTLKLGQCMEGDLMSGVITFLMLVFFLFLSFQMHQVRLLIFKPHPAVRVSNSNGSVQNKMEACLSTNMS